MSADALEASTLDPVIPTQDELDPVIPTQDELDPAIQAQDELEPVVQAQAELDPVKMSWIPWSKYKTRRPAAQFWIGAARCSSDCFRARLGGRLWL